MYLLHSKLSSRNWEINVSKQTTAMFFVQLIAYRNAAWTHMAVPVWLSGLAWCPSVVCRNIMIIPAGPVVQH